MIRLNMGNLTRGQHVIIGRGYGRTKGLARADVEAGRVDVSAI